MEKISISDPDNINVYPLSKEIYHDETILYHGTSSVWADKIEVEGLKLNDPPYPVAQIASLVAEFEKFFPFDSYPNSVWAAFNVLKYYTVGQGNCFVHNKIASFTSGYWTAVAFASTPLGETINRLLMFKERFIKFTQDEHEIGTVMGDLRDKIEEYHASRSLILRAIEKNEAGYDSLINALVEISRPYDENKENHYPVIFVLKPPIESMLNWNPSRLHGYPRRIEIMDEILPREDISPEVFLYRIDFPNGPKTELMDIEWQNTEKTLPWETKTSESKDDRPEFFENDSDI